MGFGGAQSVSVQQARCDVSIQQNLRDPKRRLGQREQKTRDQEDRNVFHVVALHTAGTHDMGLGFSWSGLGLGFMGVFLMSSGCKKPPLTLIIREIVIQACSIIFKHINDAAMTYVCRIGSLRFIASRCLGL